MEVLIKATNLSKTIEGKLLFDNATFEIQKENCIGLLGSNGSGKTTLFKILLGYERANFGDLWKKDALNIRILNQIAISTKDKTIADFFSQSTQPVHLQQQIQNLEKKLENPDIYASSEYQYVLEELQQLQVSAQKTASTVRFEAAAKLLKEIGISDISWTENIETFSGGERQKIALTSVFAKPNDCDLLLLDEPTNHLDIETIEWLERKIVDFPGAIVIISHDRYLLDDLVDHVFELENTRLFTYTASFEEYEEEKKISEHNKLRAYEKNQAESNRQKKIIQTLTRRNKYDLQIASKMKRFEKLKQLDNPVLKSYLLRFQFKSLLKSGKNVAEGHQLIKRYGEKTILRDADFEILAGQKIGLIGPNGCGKTTFLKILTGEEHADSGTVHISSGVQWGYFDQGHLSLKMDNTLLDEILRDHKELSENDAKALLGQFNFKGTMIQNKVNQLSGGERARLAILRLVMQPYNLLILDEPTNHMDMVSKQAIETALASYSGTVIAVSHDRRFLDMVTDTIFFMDNASLKMYSGNYSSFRQQRIKQLSDQDAAQHALYLDSTKYVVRKKFTIWTTKTKYAVGDELYIGDHNEKEFEWALKNRFLISADEAKKKK